MKWIFLVLVGSFLFCSVVFADSAKPLSYYQGDWERDAQNHGLSKIVIMHPADHWLMRVYEHCASTNDCLIAQIPLQVNENPETVVSKLQAVWKQLAPESNHLILFYYLVLKPDDASHIDWQVEVRQKGAPAGTGMTMQGVMDRADQTSMTPMAGPDKKEVPAKTVAIDATDQTTANSCQPLQIRCVLKDDPLHIVGIAKVTQHMVTNHGKNYCLPMMLQKYDAANLSLLFAYNKVVCMQQFPQSCANHACVALFHRTDQLGLQVNSSAGL